MNALVIAQRYFPVDSDPEMELRLAFAEPHQGIVVMRR
jgi:hypothetical protein